ncbi:MAG: pilus assembly protein [Chloroflexi bacterium]|nr:MAG: pilus assembly protein [Chloroflexota bacterium]TME39126.1 MAG: pilus assembly protein [Chloroflexota bacterium]TME49706.1 MAG: pilus assembly protein [Chloroflexota bacterium]
MGSTRRRGQRGQAIVLIALIISVLLGFLGLSIDGGRAFLDRRQMQASVDASALAAAFNYMNNSDYSQAELAATNEYANNERLYMAPSCSGYGGLTVTCTFSDPTSHSLVITVANRSIAGVTFTATAVHSIGVTVMQVLGFGSTIPVGATATALARRTGTNGAAIQTLSPGSCNGASASLTFQGSSTTTVTGDVWSNGSIFDNSASAGGAVNGNVVDVCGAPPALNTPSPWTVSGAQVNGWNMPDPGYLSPPINSTSRSWNGTSGSVERPGTYTVDPSLAGGAGCYFLAGGVYDFKAGFSQNGGFVSNELRPPDEPNMAAAGQPNMTTLRSDLTGARQTSIAVNALPGPVPQGSLVSLWGGGQAQTFTVAANAATGATTLSINRQDVVGTIPTGSELTIRAVKQFWDLSGTCSSSFTLTPTGTTGFGAGTYSVEVTAVRWEANGVSSCTGPISPTCYIRESAPSMCKTVTLGASGNVRVAVTTELGATDFNVYLAPNGTCSGLTYCDHTNGGSSVTINTCPTGQPGPPDWEGLPLASGLPNADPPAAAPPRGDLANENHCVDPTSGSNASCPSAFVPGAVVFYLPSGGCLDLHATGDIYIYSGYQYQRVVLFLPGPEQSPQPNTCTTNKVNGGALTSLIGIFYMPAATVTINGGSVYQATIAGGVIAWTATITGNGNLAILADPSLRAWPSAVRLIQ